LLEQVNNGKNELSTEADAVEQAIAELKQKIDTAQQELVQELEETKGAIAALDDKVAELTPGLETDLQEAEEALNSLHDQEVGTELEQIATQTVQELQTVATDLQGFQTELTQHTDSFEGYIADQALPAITNGVAGLNTQLDSTITHFNDQTEAVSDGVEQSFQELMGQVRQGQEDTFTQLEDNTQKLEEVMGKLYSAVETASSSVLDAGQTLVDGTELTSEGCKKAIELLTDAKDSLEKL
jgi:DNA repair exonuclease SbcCD ATPase subunit